MADLPASIWTEVEALLRAGDKDRWLADLFAPEPARRHLQALHAFNLEVARVREVVSGPVPGEIRLQWWRDLLNGEARGDARGSPVATALIETIERCRLPRQALLDLLEARAFDLYDDAMPTLNDLEGYCGETSSVLIQLGAIICMGGADSGSADAAGHAGVAYALTGLMRALPLHARRGQCFVPLDMLARHGAAREDIVTGRASEGVLAVLAELRARARHHLAEGLRLIRSVPRPARPAFLPLALVAPYLAALERAATTPFDRVAQLPQWRRQWALWRAAQHWR